MDTAPTASTPDMACPRCGAMSPALEGSGSVIAWYSCPSCEAFWSARIRAGQPTDPIPMEQPGPHRVAAA